MDAAKKVCWFCKKPIDSNPVAVTGRTGSVRHFHYYCSNVDRSSVPAARVIKLEKYKK